MSGIKMWAVRKVDNMVDPAIVTTIKKVKRVL